MPIDFDLEDLSPRAFEQLAVALAQKVIGPGVEAFGSGPDGGREATFDGTIRWSNTSMPGDDEWSGYTVLQAKQRERLGEPNVNLSWLATQVTAELDSWRSAQSNRRKLPRYLIFITNVRLSSVPEKGIDKINAHLERQLDKGKGEKGGSLRSRGLRRVRVWHRDQITTLLSDAPGIRATFKSLLTVGDLNEMLRASQGALQPADFHNLLHLHGDTSLRSDQWVRFSETADLRHKIPEVFVDLPTSGRDEIQSVMTALLERSEMVLKPSMRGDMRNAHLVLTGQAGSGKSTVSKFVTQLLRSNFLIAQTDLTRDSIAVRDETLAACARLGLSAPRNRRWPIRVDLPDYADEAGPGGGPSLLNWMARQVSERSELDVKGYTLRRWMQHWPSVVIFDGLDEVTAPSVRERVIDEISSFVADMERDDADLFVMVTTRPTGDGERIDPARFDQLDLAYLDEAKAQEFAELVMTKQWGDEPDRLRLIRSRFEQQSRQPAVANLMRTPLQVAIITVILERHAALPADRYRLFWQYFETILGRESGKRTALAPLLTEHERLIRELHETVGLELQVRSETVGDAKALLPHHRLRDIIRNRLLEIGEQDGVGLNRLVSQLLEATTKRLVLLVPGENDEISFEIRSLQELMAARALTSGREEQVLQDLKIVARSAHWRNTFIFAAGRIFADFPDHMRESLTVLVERLDDDPRVPSWLAPLAPAVASAVLEDGLAASTPRWQLRFVDVALHALESDGFVSRGVVIRGLASARRDANARTLIDNRLRDASLSMPRKRWFAQSIAWSVDFLRADSDRKRASIVTGPPVSWAFEAIDPEKFKTRTVDSFLRPHLEKIEPLPTEAQSLDSALEVFEFIEVAVSPDGDPIPNRVRWRGSSFVSVVEDPATSNHLRNLFGCLDPIREWRLQVIVGEVVNRQSERRIVGESLGSQHLPESARSLSAG